MQQDTTMAAREGGSVDVDDYAQPLEAVARSERRHVCPLPLRVADRRALFGE